MILITDEEAQNWPLSTVVEICGECGCVIHTVCDYCGKGLCDELDCIKAHASKGCYNNHRHAHDSQTPLDQYPSPDARPQHDPQNASTEPAVDGQAVEAASIPKGR